MASGEKLVGSPCLERVAKAYGFLDNAVPLGPDMHRACKTFIPSLTAARILYRFLAAQLRPLIRHCANGKLKCATAECLRNVLLLLFKSKLLHIRAEAATNEPLSILKVRPGC